MARPDRYELLTVASLAGMIAIFLSQVTALFCAPASTPMDFALREAEQRDGPEALGAGRSAARMALQLAFVGDIMQHRRQASDDFPACYSGIKPLLIGADVAAGNLEFPVDATRPVGPPVGSVQFNGSPAHVAALAGAGLDVLSTANNHCFDQGVEAAARTNQQLVRCGLTPVGTLMGPARDRPVIIERNGFRIGFFAYTFRPNSYPDAGGETRYWKPDWPLHELNFTDWTAEYRAEGLEVFARHARAARDAHVDWLVALVHWGREWSFQPTADQRLAGRDLIDHGFDLVVGGHGHVLNPVEIYRDRLIAYSLGNLISDFRPWQARLGAVLQVDLTFSGRLRIADFRAIPIQTERDGHLVRPVEAARAAHQPLRDLARRVLGPACVILEPPIPRR
jgi:poly-gamma-glutamate synthesis protein (capsule biosynthesis protein)